MSSSTKKNAQESPHTHCSHIEVINLVICLFVHSFMLSFKEGTKTFRFVAYSMMLLFMQLLPFREAMNASNLWKSLS